MNDAVVAMGKSYYVYLLTNEWKNVLYVGVTNDLARRMYEHRQGLVEGFTKTYHVKQLVHYEETTDGRRRLNAKKLSKDGGDRKRMT